MLDARASSWCEVAFNDFGDGDRSFCRGEHGLVWRFDEHHFGVRLRDVGVLSTVAVHGLVTRALTRVRGPVRLLTDSRELRLARDNDRACAVQAVVESVLGTVRPHLVRYAMIAPQDWSTPWWHGVHVFAGLPCAWRVVIDEAEAFEWLEFPGELRNALTDLIARSQPRGPMTRTVDALVATLLDADVEAAARRLGMSVRSLQRSLGQEGQTFQAVRTRRRLLAARELLRQGNKVESVAREIGFASTSHFVIWFRQHCGATPSDYRRAAPMQPERG